MTAHPAPGILSIGPMVPAYRLGRAWSTMNILSELPREYRKEVVVKHGRDKERLEYPIKSVILAEGHDKYDKDDCCLTCLKKRSSHYHVKCDVCGRVINGQVRCFECNYETQSRVVKQQKQRDTEIELRDRYHFIPTESSYTKRKITVKARTNKLIDPLVNRFEELDKELEGFIQVWNRNKKQPLVIAEITDWANYVIARRIKRILSKQYSHLSGKVRISEHEECIIVEWMKQ